MIRFLSILLLSTVLRPNFAGFPENWQKVVFNGGMNVQWFPYPSDWTPECYWKNQPDTAWYNSHRNAWTNDDSKCDTQEYAHAAFYGSNAFGSGITWLNCADSDSPYNKRECLTVNGNTAPAQADSLYVNQAVSRGGPSWKFTKKFFMGAINPDGSSERTILHINDGRPDSRRFKWGVDDLKTLTANNLVTKTSPVGLGADQMACTWWNQPGTPDDSGLFLALEGALAMDVSGIRVYCPSMRMAMGAQGGPSWWIAGPRCTRNADPNNKKKIVCTCNDGPDGSGAPIDVEFSQPGSNLIEWNVRLVNACSVIKQRAGYWSFVTSVQTTFKSQYSSTTSHLSQTDFLTLLRTEGGVQFTLGGKLAPTASSSVEMKAITDFKMSNEDKSKWVTEHSNSVTDGEVCEITLQQGYKLYKWEYFMKTRCSEIYQNGCSRRADFPRSMPPPCCLPEWQSAVWNVCNPGNPYGVLREQCKPPSSSEQLSDENDPFGRRFACSGAEGEECVPHPPLEWYEFAIVNGERLHVSNLTRDEHPQFFEDFPLEPSAGPLTQQPHTSVLSENSSSDFSLGQQGLLLLCAGALVALMTVLFTFGVALCIYRSQFNASEKRQPEFAPEVLLPVTSPVVLTVPDFVSNSNSLTVYEDVLQKNATPRQL